jgi:hypothetical protein
MTSIYKTFFYDIDGSLLGSANDILPIPLKIGMQITIHGCEGTFEVSEWNFHHGHPDEYAGLRIVLKRSF